MKHSIICTAFKPQNKATLRGFADIEIAELRLKISGVCLHEKNGGRWVTLPGRPWVEDGLIQTDDQGKAKYATILEFSDKGTANAFSQRVWEAVETFTVGGAQ